MNSIKSQFVISEEISKKLDHFVADRKRYHETRSSVVEKALILYLNKHHIKKVKK